MDLECTFSLSLGSHKEVITCNVANIGKHSIVLGMSWLKLHNPTIEWPAKRVIFNSQFCSTNCLSVCNDILGNVGGHTHFEGIPEDLGGVKVPYAPLEGIPREVGDIAAIPLEGVPTEL